MSKQNRSGQIGGIVVHGYPNGPSTAEIAEQAIAVIEASRATQWPPAIPVSEEPPEGKPLMAWADGRWQEAFFTTFWTREKAEWRTHPAGVGISPTHYQYMPPAPEGIV